jgi:uncharacterized protein YxjI
MNHLYIKQKVFSLSGKFAVKNQLEKDVYYVEGSFLQIPKTFSIMNTTRDEVEGLAIAGCVLFLRKLLNIYNSRHLKVGGFPTFSVYSQGNKIEGVKKDDESICLWNVA